MISLVSCLFTDIPDIFDSLSTFSMCIFPIILFQNYRYLSIHRSAHSLDLSPPGLTIAMSLMNPQYPAPPILPIRNPLPSHIYYLLHSLMRSIFAFPLLVDF